MSRIEAAKNSRKISARSIAGIAGTIISMCPAMGSITRLMTRAMYGFVTEAKYWDSKLKVTDEVKSELEFWLQNINVLNGYTIKQKHAITKVVYTDASSQSWVRGIRSFTVGECYSEGRIY